MTTYVVLDFETASDCDLENAGSWRYAEDLTTEILCLSYRRVGANEEPSVWTPSDGLSEDLLVFVNGEEYIFVAHGTGFEKAVWRRIMVAQYGFPDIPNKRWECTMAGCARRAIPQGLDDAGRVLGLGELKDNDGSKHVRTLSKYNKKTGAKDRSDDAIHKAIVYCQQDIRTEEALFKRIGPLPPGERNVWLLDQRINERGIRLDLDFVRQAQKIVDDASAPLLAEFRDITHVQKLMSPKFKDWLDARDVRLPDLRKETITKLLGSSIDGDDIEEDAGAYIPALDQETRRALYIRQLIGSASIKKLARMLACVCEDGRARGLLNYHGASTGRWAGRILQPHNFPRGVVKVDIGGKMKSPPPEVMVDAIMTGDHLYVEALFGPAVEAVLSALRHAIICELDRRLNAGDYAGIEARIVLALAGQHDKTALMAAGNDVYLDMAEDIYNAPKGSYDIEVHAKERTIGKNTVLGLGFQMGAPKFHARYCPDQPIEFAQRVVKAYREKWAPEVPKLWRGLERAAVDAVWKKKPCEAYGVEYALEDGWLTARLPSGRKLWYRNPQPVRKEMPWSTDEEPDVRAAWTYQVMKTGRWKTVDAYGGLLTENVVQALARDIMVQGMFNCEKENFPIVLTVHDEIVSEPLATKSDPELLKSLMSDLPSWARSIKVPIQAETWEGGRYKK